MRAPPSSQQHCLPGVFGVPKAKIKNLHNTYLRGTLVQIEPKLVRHQFIVQAVCLELVVPDQFRQQVGQLCGLVQVDQALAHVHVVGAGSGGNISFYRLFGNVEKFMRGFFAVRQFAMRKNVGFG